MFRFDSLWKKDCCYTYPSSTTVSSESIFNLAVSFQLFLLFRFLQLFQLAFSSSFQPFLFFSFPSFDLFEPSSYSLKSLVTFHVVLEFLFLKFFRFCQCWLCKYNSGFTMKNIDDFSKTRPSAKCRLWLIRLNLHYEDH